MEEKEEEEKVEEEEEEEKEEKEEEEEEGEREMTHQCEANKVVVVKSLLKISIHTKM